VTEAAEQESAGPQLGRVVLELRRGVLVLAVLVALRSEEYGYSLRKKLLDAHLDVEEGTLYPLVRRLESQGLLNSDWRESASRKRRYYRLSADGETLLAALEQEWELIVGSLNDLWEKTA
jgi:PadR family transcriptional regulator, regulatory protein PadR